MSKTTSALRTVVLLDGDVLAKRPLVPLLRLEALSAGKECETEERSGPKMGRTRNYIVQ